MNSQAFSTSSSTVDFTQLYADEHGLGRVQIIVEGTLMVVIWLVSLIGNILVCLVVHRSRRLQSTTNCFVVSLACSDLLTTCIVLPLLFFQMIYYKWPFYGFICKILRMLQHLIPGSTMFVLVSICADRFYTTVFPLSFKVTRTRAKQMCGASWLTASLISLPSMYYYNVNDNKCKMLMHSTDWNALAYLTFVAVAVVIVPIGAMSFAYFKVFKFIWRFDVPTYKHTNSKLNKDNQRAVSRSTIMNRIPRLKARMISMIMMTTTVTSLCIVLFYAPQILHWSLGSSRVFLELSTLAYLFTTAVKPCLYAAYNTNFRRGALEVFCSSTLKCYRSNLYTITTTSQIGKRNHVGTITPPIHNTSIIVNDVKPRPPLIPIPRLPIEASISLISSFNSEQHNTWI